MKKVRVQLKSVSMPKPELVVEIPVEIEVNYAYTPTCKSMIEYVMQALTNEGNSLQQ
jgi:hypothetical protein